MGRDAQARKPPRSIAWTSTPVLLGCVLLVSLGIFFASILYGYHAAHQCALANPLGRRCSVTELHDWFLGLLSGAATLIIGGILVLFRKSKQKNDTQS